jgi:hypothetical protein
MENSQDRVYLWDFVVATLSQTDSLSRKRSYRLVSMEHALFTRNACVVEGTCLTSRCLANGQMRHTIISNDIKTVQRQNGKR